MLTTSNSTGLPPAAPEQPSAHKDADVRQSRGAAGSARVVDRARQEQARPLHQLAGAEDGRLRRFRQRAAGPFAHQRLAAIVRRQDEREGEDLADPRQQFSRKDTPDSAQAVGAGLC